MPIGTAPSSSEWAGSLAWTCAEESLQNCLSSIGPFHFWHWLDNKFNLSSHLMLISNFLHPGFWITANMPLGIANRINNQHPYRVNVWLDPVLHSGVIISHKSSCRKILLFAGELHILWFFLILHLPLLQASLMLVFFPYLPVIQTSPHCFSFMPV